MEFEQLSGMESINAEFDNVYNLTAGFEAISEAGAAVSYDGFEAHYAFTVFNLNGIDVSGQEGFVDSIKRGAAKVYEWIKDLIKTIRGWFTGKSKADYEKAKKEIKETEKEVDAFQNFNIDMFIRENRGTKEEKVINAVPSEAKQEIAKQIRQVDTGASSTAELREKIIGTVINDIASNINARVGNLETIVKEIQRVDPNGDTRRALGVDAATAAHKATLLKDLFSKEDQIDFVKATNKLVELSELAQSEIAKATQQLDRMNETAKGHEERQHSLSRAVSIVKCLTNAAEVYRDAVTTLNSKAAMGYKHAKTRIVRDAILEAIKSSDAATAQYIKQAMEEVGL